MKKKYISHCRESPAGAVLFPAEVSVQAVCVSPAPVTRATWFASNDESWVHLILTLTGDGYKLAEDVRDRDQGRGPRPALPEIMEGSATRRVAQYGFRIQVIRFGISCKAGG